MFSCVFSASARRAGRTHNLCPCCLRTFRERRRPLFLNSLPVYFGARYGRARALHRCRLFSIIMKRREPASQPGASHELARIMDIIKANAIRARSFRPRALHDNL
jgi:hypothetical protein